MKKFLTRAAICMTPWALGACEKELINDDNVITESSLSISTRSVTAEETVSFPVSIFVFDNTSKRFVKNETLTDKDEAIGFSLPFGSYAVYAIGGADDQRYDFPTGDDITEDAEVSLKDGKEHADLMAAHDAVTLEQKEGNQLTLHMERMVTELSQVTIKNVPEDFTNVSITLHDYKGIQINGEFGSIWEHEYTLHDDGGGSWSLPAPTLLLIDADEATVTISMTKSDGAICNYSYTCTEEIKKNHRISITGTYQEDKIAQLTGVITGTTWAGNQEIVFEFGESNTANGDDDHDSDLINQVAPQAYSMYNDCFVVRVTTDDKGHKEVLLLYNEDFNIEIKDKTTAQIIQEVNDNLNNIAINEITGWRLPCKDEVLAENNIVGYIMQSKLKTKPTNDFYLYLDNEELKAYSRTVTDRTYTFAKLYRPVTVLKFKK